MIPHYHLKQAQAALAGVAAPDIIAMKFTAGNMSEVLRRCKLYDYEAHAWVNFDGEVTAIPLDCGKARARPASDLLPDQADPGSPGVFFPASSNQAAPEPTARARREKA
jgi:hypothetical protein